MTENEAVHCLKVYTDETVCEECDFYPNCTHETQSDMARLAIKALEEIQQYRAIGTVEECREAMERQRAKKPTPIDYEKYIGVVNNAECLRGAYWCPNCNHAIRSGDYCNDCGQAIDWSDIEHIKPRKTADERTLRI